jgi:hypothetical protein
MLAPTSCRNPSLGLVTKAKVYKDAGQEKCERMWESVSMNTHTPKWSSILGVGVLVDFQICRERLQRSKHLILRVFYIISKLLKCRCLKWARMTHLDICNTSYGKKKGWESNWQFDSRPQKVENRPNFHACRWRAICRWKALDERCNFALDFISIGGLSTKL